MASNGYIRGRPDLSWWDEQIKRGEDFRKKEACEDHWDTWRKYYRGDWSSRVLPVNVFFSMLRATVPRVYFRNPAVSITPALPGYLHMAFAQVLNRIDNRLIEIMDFKSEIKDMVQEAFLRGTSIGKLGFGGEFTPTVEDLLSGNIPESERGETYEYSSAVHPNTPWFLRLDTRDVVVPAGLTKLNRARWVATRIRRHIDDVKGDPRLENTSSLKPTATSNSINRTKPDPDTVELIEVRDRKFRRVFIYGAGGSADEQSRVLYLGPDSLQQRRLPLFELIFNRDTDCFWGVPDAKVLEPGQLELNETNTQIMKHRRLSLIKLLIEKNAIDDEEIAKLFSEEVLAAVKVNSLTGIEKLQVASIPQDLVTAKQLAMQDIRDTIGFSRNQLGEFQTRRGDTSATEAEYVQQGSEIRVDERRDLVADLIQTVMTEMNYIIFDQWDKDILVDLVGPGGSQVWVTVNPRMLGESKYVVKVDPDSANSRTRAQREAKAVAIYNLLKTNPLIDPMKLTRYLLTEIEGVEMDDLIKQMPAQAGAGVSGGPITLPAYAQMLQGSIAAMNGVGANGQAPQIQ